MCSFRNLGLSKLFTLTSCATLCTKITMLQNQRIFAFSNRAGRIHLCPEKLWNCDCPTWNCWFDVLMSKGKKSATFTAISRYDQEVWILFWGELLHQIQADEPKVSEAKPLQCFNWFSVLAAIKSCFPLWKLFLGFCSFHTNFLASQLLRKQNILTWNWKCRTESNACFPCFYCTATSVRFRIWTSSLSHQNVGRSLFLLLLSCALSTQTSANSLLIPLSCFFWCEQHSCQVFFVEMKRSCRSIEQPFKSLLHSSKVQHLKPSYNSPEERCENNQPWVPLQTES